MGSECGRTAEMKKGPHCCLDGNDHWIAYSFGARQFEKTKLSEALRRPFARPDLRLSGLEALAAARSGEVAIFKQRQRQKHGNRTVEKRIHAHPANVLRRDPGVAVDGRLNI